MSFNTDFAAAAAPDLLESFGDTVTHRPLGDDANDAAVVAMVAWDDPAEHADGGKGTNLAGRLDVAGELTVDVRDQWVIDGRLYQTVEVGEPQGGLRRVMIRRTTSERRTRAREVL